MFPRAFQGFGDLSKVLLKPSSFREKKAPRFPKVTPEMDTHGNLNGSISQFSDKGPSSQSYGFSSSHVQM